MNFNAIDVETANADLSSICQIGLAVVHAGNIAYRWSTLVDPEDSFDDININIHGIDADKVANAPTFPDAFKELSSKIAGAVIVSHTSFDRIALARAVEKYCLSGVQLTWLDSACIARRAWPGQYSLKGYGLANIADNLGIKFNHHDALEDACVAAEIVLRASAVTGLDIEGWLRRVKQPINPRDSAPIHREGNPEGPLSGEILVFTGALELPRREAADLAAASGCRVDSGVTKKTTILIVGDQDVRRLAGRKKSSKRRKAESLIEKGCRIRILCETDFKKIILPN